MDSVAFELTLYQSPPLDHVFKVLFVGDTHVGKSRYTSSRSSLHG